MHEYGRDIFGIIVDETIEILRKIQRKTFSSFFRQIFVTVNAKKIIVYMYLDFFVPKLFYYRQEVEYATLQRRKYLCLKRFFAFTLVFTFTVISFSFQIESKDIFLTINNNC